MVYTNKEYAEMAIKANTEGKKLIDNNGILTLQDIVRTKEEIAASNQATLNSLISEATHKINVLTDAIEIELAEDGDNEKLVNWKKYRVLLTRVDNSLEIMDLPEKPS